MAYHRRTVDAELDELLRSLPAVALEGARGVGKTATGTQRATRVFSLDAPSVAELVTADLTQLDGHGGTVLIDEWQRQPAVWDHVRRQVDAGARPATYLLAGSAVPVDAPVHSGAGRIVTVRMRPLSLAERDLATPTVSLGALLAGAAEVGGTTSVGLRDYIAEAVASGFPGIRPLRGRARRAQLDGYLARVVERDFADQGLRVRRPATLRGWLAAYAAATSTTASYTTILAAATPGQGDKPAKTTVMDYRDVLEQLWLLDAVPGWAPGLSRLTRLSQAPKHHLADPALAARLLGVEEETLLSGTTVAPTIPREGTLAGALFESLVSLSVKVYAQASEASVHHLRDRDGRHEIDLIVQRADQRVVAIEVKLGQTPGADDVRHLLWLREQIGERVLASMVVTTGTTAYRRPDGIAVVPAALLGP